MAIEIRFRKTGREIKAAVAQRSEQLRARLEARNRVLSEFIENISRKLHRLSVGRN